VTSGTWDLIINGEIKGSGKEGFNGLSNFYVLGGGTPAPRNAVPVPGSIPLAGLALGLMGLALRRRRGG
jgi:hypothetical protein